MTRHYKKKSFLSQAQHDIRGQVRAAKRLGKSLCMVSMKGWAYSRRNDCFLLGKPLYMVSMKGWVYSRRNTSKNIRYGQGEMINGNSSAKNIREATIYRQEEMINGNSSAKNIREATIYRHVQGEMINRSTSAQSSGHENLNRLHVKDKFTPEVQNQPSNSNFDAHYQNYCRCCNYSYCNCKAKGKGGIYRTKSCMYWRRIFDVRFHKIKLPWE
ncbi:unnamed protein product [Rhizophagus irregularis]|nr:unnamed protein product [Rhizophagus irregularis]CAB5350830.1 unnamed protein product [Rhizophagus irregularis]